MNRRGRSVLFFVTFLFFLTGCTKELDKVTQKFNDRGVSYELKLPGGWEANEQAGNEYSLQAIFSAEDRNSNSYLFVVTAPVSEVKQAGFGEETRKKLKERYNYNEVEDIYMQKLNVGDASAYKYTLNTVYQEKSVWAHFYYIWTKNSFVQLIFYSADDGSYKKRSERIDASVNSFKEVSFNEQEAEEAQKIQKKDEGDVITIENQKLKMETTAVRTITGTENKRLLAIRYTFTNLSKEVLQPAVWKELVTAKQNGEKLEIGTLPRESTLLDVRELDEKQTVLLKQGEAIESVVFYELLDQSTVELSFSQEEFPGREATNVVIPT